MMTLNVFGISDPGLTRKSNEDAFLVSGMVERTSLQLRLDECGVHYQRWGLLCAVADGLGGHSGAAVASETVLKGLAAAVPRADRLIESSQAEEYLAQVVRGLDQQLLSTASQHTALAGMSSTLVGIYVCSRYGLCFHAGDSRLYRFRAGGLLQMTSDHTAQPVVRTAGRFAQTPAAKGPITNALGGSPGSCSLELAPLSFREGDTLLLCSDGLSDMLKFEAIEYALGRSHSIEDAGLALVNMANTAGGRDNITLVLIARGG